MGPVKFPACYRGNFCVRQKVDLKRKFFVTVFRSSIKNCRILDSSWPITYEYKHDYAQIATYKYRYRSHLLGKRVMLGTINIQMRIFFFKALGYSVFKNWSLIPVTRLFLCMEWSSQELTRELKVYRLLFKVDVENYSRYHFFLQNSCRSKKAFNPILRLGGENWAYRQYSAGNLRTALSKTFNHWQNGHKKCLRRDRYSYVFWILSRSRGD